MGEVNRKLGRGSVLPDQFGNNRVEIRVAYENLNLVGAEQLLCLEAFKAGLNGFVAAEARELFAQDGLFFVAGQYAQIP